MKTILRNTAILLAITLVATVALSFVYQITKDPIALSEQKKKEAAYREVYAEAAGFEEKAELTEALTAFNAARTDGSSVKEVLQATGADGSVLGYVMTVSSTKGYGGEVRLALGVDAAGTVKGYAVLSHSESPGFGANCENADIREQFVGIRSADEVEGISGATYTTKALKAETQAAIDFVLQIGGGAQ